MCVKTSFADSSKYRLSAVPPSSEFLYGVTACPIVFARGKLWVVASNLFVCFGFSNLRRLQRLVDMIKTLYFTHCVGTSKQSYFVLFECPVRHSTHLKVLT